MLPALVLLFVLVPIAELAIIIQVGQAIGVWWTVAILVADSLIGSALMRSQGRATWTRFNEAMQTGRVPAAEVLDGGMVIFGGACLLTPGFVTDLFGLLLLLPPTRALLRRQLIRRFALKMVGHVASSAFASGGRGPEAGGPAGGSAKGARPASGEPPFDVEGTARDVQGKSARP